jgi:hypothetical protein
MISNLKSPSCPDLPDRSGFARLRPRRALPACLRRPGGAQAAAGQRADGTIEPAQSRLGGLNGAIDTLGDPRGTALAISLRRPGPRRDVCEREGTAEEVRDSEGQEDPATLRELLEESGLSQRDLARRTSLSPKHVNRLLQGVVPLSADIAQRLELVTGGDLRLARAG